MTDKLVKRVTQRGREARVAAFNMLAATLSSKVCRKSTY
jgi:hypothetical protein